MIQGSPGCRPATCPCPNPAAKSDPVRCGQRSIDVGRIVRHVSGHVGGREKYAPPIHATAKVQLANRQTRITSSGCLCGLSAAKRRGGRGEACGVGNRGFCLGALSRTLGGPGAHRARAIMSLGRVGLAPIHPGLDSARTGIWRASVPAPSAFSSSTRRAVRESICRASPLMRRTSAASAAFSRCSASISCCCAAA